MDTKKKLPYKKWMLTGLKKTLCISDTDYAIKLNNTSVAWQSGMNRLNNIFQDWGNIALGQTGVKI